MTLTLTQLRAALDALPLHALAQTNVLAVNRSGEDVALEFDNSEMASELARALECEQATDDRCDKLEDANETLRERITELGKEIAKAKGQP